MTIFGIGIDVVDVDRIDRNLKEHGERFLERIAHADDLRHAPSNEGNAARIAQYWAARFAVKEAFAKALGTGFGKTVRWNSVGIAKLESGKPILSLSAELETVVRERGITGSEISISH